MEMLPSHIASAELSHLKFSGREACFLTSKPLFPEPTKFHRPTFYLIENLHTICLVIPVLFYRFSILALTCKFFEDTTYASLDSLRCLAHGWLSSPLSTTSNRTDFSIPVFLKSTLNNRKALHSLNPTRWIIRLAMIVSSWIARTHLIPLTPERFRFRRRVTETPWDDK